MEKKTEWIVTSSSQLELFAIRAKRHRPCGSCLLNERLRPFYEFTLAEICNRKCNFFRHFLLTMPTMELIFLQSSCASTRRLNSASFIWNNEKNTLQIVCWVNKMGGLWELYQRKWMLRFICSLNGWSHWNVPVRIYQCNAFKTSFLKTAEIMKCFDNQIYIFLFPLMREGEWVISIEIITHWQQLNSLAEI